MKFVRLRLTNIGPFYGNYEFDLRTNGKEQNVVLFGGKNGSGKTTILESIRLVLFGTFAFGLKNESSVYFERIDTKLNFLAKKQNERLFQIILDLEIVENLTRNQYTIKRGWVRKKNALQEQVLIHRNDRILNERESEIFLARLREETPPQLLEFFLFDGEKISQVVSNDTLSSYLQQTAKIMFNLDLFENLEADLNSYVKQENIFNTLSSDEKKLMEMAKTRDTYSRRKQETVTQLEQIDREIDDARAALNELLRQFEVHGGLVKERRDALLNEINELERKRQTMMERNREWITTHFPFLLVRDLLASAIDQMHKEAKLDVKNHVARLISERDLAEILASVLGQDPGGRDYSEPGLILYQKLLDKLSSDDLEIIHNASSQQRAEIEAFYMQIRDFRPEGMLDDFKQNAELIKTIQQLRRQVDENDSSSDLKHLLEQIQQLQGGIVAKEHHKKQLLTLLEEINEQLTRMDAEYNALKTKLLKEKKKGHILEIVTKVTELSQMFRERQLKKKLQQVEIETTQMLQRIFRKELFVTRVKIDSASFQVRLYDANDDELNIEILSAGEKQILLLSIVWAMAACSGRNLPFIFDTLLGRLDQTHRKSIIEQFIPRCGEQVVILATDSEIAEENFQQIRRLLAQTYTIDFDPNLQKVIVTNDYFTMAKLIEGSSYELST